jgi:hypothetical protein
VERVERIGYNERLFREVNERIESAELGFGQPHMFELVCECGDDSCMERVSVSTDAYRKVREDPVLFFVRPGHEAPDVEDVVERTPHYFVVRKHEGKPARIARGDV